jgi:hypothetical protein
MSAIILLHGKIQEPWQNMNIYLRRKMEFEAIVKKVAPFDRAWHALGNHPHCAGIHEWVPRRRCNIGAWLSLSPGASSSND